MESLLADGGHRAPATQELAMGSAQQLHACKGSVPILGVLAILRKRTLLLLQKKETPASVKCDDKPALR